MLKLHAVKTGNLLVGRYLVTEFIRKTPSVVLVVIDISDKSPRVILVLFQKSAFANSVTRQIAL